MIFKCLKSYLNFKAVFIGLFFFLFSTLTGQESHYSNVFGCLDSNVFFKLKFKKTKNDEIEGQVTYGKNRELQYEIEGLSEDSLITLYEIDDQNKVAGIFEFNRNNGRWIWKNAYTLSQLPIILKNKQKKNTTPNYISHQSLIFHSTPNYIKHNAQNKELQKKITLITDRIKNQYQENEAPLNSAKNRFKQQCHGQNSTLVNNQFIESGYITFYNNQSFIVHTIGYTWDKSKKSLLSLNSIFKKDFNYPFFIKQMIRKSRYKKAANTTSDINANFENYSFGLSEKGLNIISQYDTIYGRSIIVIPFHQIKKNIANKAILAMIKHQNKSKT